MQNNLMGNIKYKGLLMALLLLAGCSTNFSNDTVDYKSAGEKKTPNLAFPPDLTSPSAEKRYTVTEGAATLSQYNARSSKVKNLALQSGGVLAPVEGMKIERQGDKRWLVVKKPAADLYPKVKEFWEQTGFLLVTDAPRTGIMETDWAENRAKIPQDIVRRTLGKVLDSIYSTGERDKFRTRFETNAQGETEIYVTHRGAVEELVGTNKESSMWTGRPSDPELEIEMLSRMMIYLGATNEQAKAATSAVSGATTPRVSRVQANGADSLLNLAQGFDRAWREVGLGLDRSNFTVEDRDRAQGIYFVRFVNPNDLEAEKKEGFFANLFKSSKNDELKKAKRYRVVVRSGGDANATRVMVQDNDGKPAAADATLQILNILDQQVGR